MEKAKIKVTLDADALALLDGVVSPRKRGWYISMLIRQNLQEETIVSDLILALRRFEGTLVKNKATAGHRGPVEKTSAARAVCK